MQQYNITYEKWVSIMDLLPGSIYQSDTASGPIFLLDLTAGLGRGYDKVSLKPYKNPI
jgi:hypothetical protein